MNRRELIQSGLASITLASMATAQEVAKKTVGLPPLTIKDVKVITTAGGPGNRYRWIFLKSSPANRASYGIGSANDIYQADAVANDLETHLKPWLIEKDAERIEDLWQAEQMSTYWRNGVVNNNMLSAMDMALWDIKENGRTCLSTSCWAERRATPSPYTTTRAATPKSSASIPCRNRWPMDSPTYASSWADMAAEEIYRRARAIVPKADFRARSSTRSFNVNTIPPLFDYLREKAGFQAKLIHDVHSHMTGMNAVELSRRLQPCQLYYLEDVLGPEQLSSTYRNIREICTTPQAVGEVFANPLEIIPLIVERNIDFMRNRIAASGGITPIRKLAILCELFGVKTAFQEGG